MAMILALAIAVMLDKWAYYLPGGQTVASNRSTLWLTKYLAKMMELVNNSRIKQNYLIITMLIVPLLVVLLLAQLLFAVLFGTIGLILFVAAVLFYLLGNNKKDKGDNEFITAHEHSFGILFWFAIIGTVGALFYWFLIVSKKDDNIVESENPQLVNGLTWIHAVAAWIPARITGFVYALVGNFTSGFNCWLNCMRTPAMPSRKVLTDCGLAATDTSIAHDDKNLLARSFIAWVVLSILILIYK